MGMSVTIGKGAHLHFDTGRVGQHGVRIVASPPSTPHTATATDSRRTAITVRVISKTSLARSGPANAGAIVELLVTLTFDLFVFRRRCETELSARQKPKQDVHHPTGGKTNGGKDRPAVSRVGNADSEAEKADQRDREDLDHVGCSDHMWGCVWRNG